MSFCLLWSHNKYKTTFINENGKLFVIQYSGIFEQCISKAEYNFPIFAVVLCYKTFILSKKYILLTSLAYIRGDRK